MTSRILSAEEVENCQPWQIPLVGNGKTPGLTRLTAEQIERIQQQAYEEGFALGRREGYAAGQTEIRSRCQQLEQILNVLDEPLRQMDEQVERELVQLSLALARQIVRREIRMDPGQVIAVVREAVEMLPVAARGIRVHLQPDDAAVVRESLTLSEERPRWRIVEDPVLSRGGCKITTDNSYIDATLDNRIAAIAATLLGGERADDKPRA